MDSANSTENVATPRTSAPSRGVIGVLRALGRRPSGIVGLTIVAIMLLVAVFGPALAPFDPVAQQVGPRLSPPGPTNWLGTDQFGRDVLSRLISGTRVSLSVGFGAVAAGGLIGVAAGLLSGYFGGLLDSVLGRLWDVLFSFPGILLGIVIVAVTGPSITGVAVAVAVVNVPLFARVCRSSVLRERELEYVDAARVLGLPHRRILLVDILPNCLGPILVQFTISVGFAVLLEASLSFLGLGTQPPRASWGNMLNESRRFLAAAPWFGVFPGLALATLLVGLNYLADALREILDPRRADE